MAMPIRFRLPYMLLCGVDDIEKEPKLPLWAQICVTTLNLQMIPVLSVDMFASVAPGRKIGVIKKKIKAGLDSESARAVNLKGVINVDVPENSCPTEIGDKYTYACFCGVEPLVALPGNMAAVYVASPSAPLHPSFHFERLGPNGIIVLQEAEARALIKEFDPDLEVDALPGRELVRALVALPALQSIRGVVVTYGIRALKGCVASLTVTEIVGDDDEDDYEDPHEESDQDEESEEYWEREERYEFDIPRAIIRPREKIVPQGIYAAFVGQLIASLYIDANQDSHAAEELSFQLERSCVTAASMALIPGNSPWDLTSRIPHMLHLRNNIEQYILSKPMLREGEYPPVRRIESVPTRPEVYWRVPESSVPLSDSSRFNSEDEDELPDLLSPDVSMTTVRPTETLNEDSAPAVDATTNSVGLARYLWEFLTGMF